VGGLESDEQVNVVVDAADRFCDSTQATDDAAQVFVEAVAPRGAIVGSRCLVEKTR
jgi:hypothetical protein